jgi:aldehyde:ferredoxin oxidoreductase
MRESQPLGLLGKILEVDLTREKWKIREFPETVEQNYLGGRGLNVKHLYDSIPPGTDPYGPDNILS